MSLPPEVTQPANSPTTQPQADDGLRNTEREMTGFERATLRWAKVAAFLSALAAIFICLQWWEMRKGGADTHDLAVAAGKQADAAKSLADRTKDLAERMKDQADKTKIIADQAVVQAQAARGLAKTASSQLVLTERPWIRIKQRILNPLAFNVGGRASGIPVAMMTVEDTIRKCRSNCGGKCPFLGRRHSC